MEIQHRYFVQYMLKQGVSSEVKALNYCQKLPVPVEDMTQLKLLVIKINREISKQYFKIAFTTCEVTQERVIVWVNTKNDAISRLQLTFSPIELEYFHVIMHEILHSGDNKLTYVVVLNISSTLRAAYSRDSGQKVLKKWIDGGYFAKRGDYVYLGPRLILEFASYLKSTCPDHICKLCSELVFTGKRCSICDKLFHSHCMDKYLTNQETCPSCKNQWVEQQNELILATTQELRDMQEGYVSDGDSMDSTINNTSTTVRSGAETSPDAADAITGPRRSTRSSQKKSNC